nr:immunoglobulin light chain junction region [Macaca mulatta]
DYYCSSWDSSLSGPVF